MAGVKPKAYVQAYQTMEKLLKSSSIGVQEIAISLGASKQWVWPTRYE